MPSTVVSTVGSVVGGIMGANSAKDAAATQAAALRDSAAISAAAAEKAKKEILDRMTPALEAYGTAIAGAQDTIKSGTADVMSILQQSTGQADQILQSIGIDAKKALLGSTATAQGIPRQSFEQQFATATGAMPAAGMPMISATPGLVTAPDAGLAATAAAQPTGATQITTQPATRPTQATTQLPAIATTAAQAAALPTIAPTIAIPETATTGGIGYAGAQQALQQGEQSALSALLTGGGQARQDILTGKQQSIDTLTQAREAALAGYTPYTQAGQAAIQQEAALSGALGPEAQQAAINAYIESPGQQYLREQQEKALLRSAAATGGLGGGAVRTALMEQAMGIAATQQQQQLENYRSLAQRGQAAVGEVGGIQTGMGTQIAGTQTAASQNLANLANAMGINASQLMSASASERAALAERTGVNLAQLEQAIGSARAAGVTQLGTGLAGAAGAATGDIAQLQSQVATTQLAGQQNISQILANLAVGAGTQSAEYTGLAGSALGTGQYLAGQQYANTIGNVADIAAYQLAQNTTTPKVVSPNLTTQATPYQDMYYTGL